MTSWLKSIQAGLKKVQLGEYEPDYEGCEHDHVVGIADEELQKLFLLFLHRKKKSKEVAAAALVLSGPARDTKLQEAARLDSEADALKSIFWVSCRHLFPELWAKPNIGIRKGWKVVWTDHDEQQQTGIIELLLGGGFGATLDDAGDDSTDAAVEGASSRTH